MEERKNKNYDRRPRQPRRDARPDPETAENLLEGRNAVTEALAAGRAIDKVYLADGDTDRGLARLAARPSRPGPSSRDGPAQARPAGRHRRAPGRHRRRRRAYLRLGRRNLPGPPTKGSRRCSSSVTSSSTRITSGRSSGRRNARGTWGHHPQAPQRRTHRGRRQGVRRGAGVYASRPRFESGQYDQRAESNAASGSAGPPPTARPRSTTPISKVRRPSSSAARATA